MFIHLLESRLFASAEVRECGRRVKDRPTGTGARMVSWDGAAKARLGSAGILGRGMSARRATDCS
jgi:hypothetical protein